MEGLNATIEYSKERTKNNDVSLSAINIITCELSDISVVFTSGTLMMQCHLLSDMVVRDFLYLYSSASA